jgi:hypothetical protein
MELVEPEIKPAIDDACLSDQGIYHLFQWVSERIRMLNQGSTHSCCQRLTPQSAWRRVGRSQTQTVAVGILCVAVAQDFDGNRVEGYTLQFPEKCNLAVRCRWRALFMRARNIARASIEMPEKDQSIQDFLAKI